MSMSCFTQISVDEIQCKPIGWHGAENDEVHHDLMFKFTNSIVNKRISFSFFHVAKMLVLFSSCQAGLALVARLRQPLALVFHATSTCQDFNLLSLVHASSIAAHFLSTPWSGSNTSSSVCWLLVLFNLMPQIICHETLKPNGVESKANKE